VDRIALLMPRHRCSWAGRVLRSLERRGGDNDAEGEGRGGRVEKCATRGPAVTELPSTTKIKQQSSITNPHSETGHFYIKSMLICGKFGAASAAGWGAGAAIFSPVGRVVLLQLWQRRLICNSFTIFLWQLQQLLLLHRLFLSYAHQLQP
jgi:hypothetical protein